MSKPEKEKLLHLYKSVYGKGITTSAFGNPNFKGGVCAFTPIGNVSDTRLNIEKIITQALNDRPSTYDYYLSQCQRGENMLNSIL